MCIMLILSQIHVLYIKTVVYYSFTASYVSSFFKNKMLMSTAS